MAIACGGNPSSSDQTWPVALEALEGGSAIYSFRFTGPFPDGAYAHVALHAADSAEACGRYSGASTASDYWFLDMEFGDIAQGPYVITTNEVLGETKAQFVNVSLLHRKDDAYVANYPALAGAVTLGAPLSVLGENSATLIAVNIDAEFSADAMQQLGCRGGQAADSSVVYTECMCQDSNGTMTTCVPDSGFQYCCNESTTARVKFDVSVSASPCAAMCRVASGLSDYCAGLNP